MAVAEPDPVPSLPALQLTIAQQFELERMSRTIDGVNDVPTLRKLAKQLLQAWQTQKAATQWMIRQHCGATMPGIPDPIVAGRQDAPIPPPWDDPLL
jgi:hypothetical protein